MLSISEYGGTYYAQYTPRTIRRDMFTQTNNCTDQGFNQEQLNTECSLLKVKTMCKVSMRYLNNLRICLRHACPKIQIIKIISLKIFIKTGVALSNQKCTKR